ncbi:histidinol-phosphate transaminase [Tepidibacillus sp. LV47]|uniref:histidinol-phosphate transaminase n=1 Tax=Tepidibacillus sp. LV47 TaxID=3398228 RepID=UPI003AB05CBA
MKPKEQIVNLPAYQPGKSMDEVKRQYNLQQVIKLASNENPFGFSPKVKQALMEGLDELHIYPDGANRKLRLALAEKLEVSEDQLIFGMGSDEIISMIARTFLEKGTQTIMATPTFPQYRSNAVTEGATIIEVPLKEGKHDLEAMKSEITKETKVIWVCNPNNPSGTFVSEEELVQFLNDVPEDILVVLDEAYYEYVTDPTYPNSVKLLDRFPNLIILRTFSKIYGLAALRIGYGIAKAKIIDWLNRVREPFNNTSLSQIAALAALSDQEFIEECKIKNANGLKQLYQGFEKLGLSYYPSQGNFVLVDLKRPADPIFQKLLERGIIVRSGVALGFPTSLRITVGNSEQNQRVLQVLAKVLNESA